MVEKIERSKVLYWGIFVVAILLAFWNCRIGVGFTDEAYSIVFGWKLFGLGDKLFVNEIYNAPRQFDLLNHIFLWWVPYSVLAIRVTSLLGFAFILSAYIALHFRRALGLSAGLIFATTLLLITHENEWWNYNAWARDLLMVHAGLLYWACRSHLSWQFCVAGLVMGLVLMAYTPLLGVGALSFLILLWVNRRGALLYGAFLLVVVAIDLGWITFLSLWEPWRHSWNTISSLGDYRVGYFSKGLGIVRHVVATPEFTWMLLALLLGEIRRRQELLGNMLFVALLAHVLLRFGILSNGFETIRTWRAVGWVAGAFLIYVGAVEKRRELLLISIPALVASMSMGLASASEKESIHWALPVLVIPFIAYWAEKTRLWSQTYWLMLVLWVALCVGSVRQKLFVASQEGFTLETVKGIRPFDGLRVSPRRLLLLQTLQRAAGKKEFALAYDFFPGMFYFGGLRSSVNTLAVQPGDSRENRKRQLDWMKAQGRYPELIVRVRQHPMSWGRSPNIQDASLAPFDETDPFNAFANCARGKTLADLPEFQALEVDPHRLAPCLSISP